MPRRTRETYEELFLPSQPFDQLLSKEAKSISRFVDRPLAESLDRLARSHDVTVLGTGANPAFIFDTFVLINERRMMASFP